jgi:hypothetical protein
VSSREHLVEQLSFLIVMKTTLSLLLTTNGRWLSRNRLPIRYLGSDILCAVDSTVTIWYWCHLYLVPELKQWLSNVTDLAKYCRAATSKFKTLYQLFPECRNVPVYFDVRFAEHVRNLTVILNNLRFTHAITDPTSKENMAQTLRLRSRTHNRSKVILTLLMLILTLGFKNYRKNRKIPQPCSFLTY